MVATSVTTPVDNELLNEVVRRILSARRPLRIILFGSHARGEARPDSDLDLLIVEDRCDPNLPTPRRATPYRTALASLDVDKDIVVYTPEEIAEWSQVPLAFPTTIMREGKVLYERPG